MTRMGHIPLRRCVACRAIQPRDVLIRFTKVEGRGVVVDEKKRLGGRGAYVCRSPTCVERVVRQGMVGRGSGVVSGWTLSAETSGLLRELVRGDGDGQAHL